MLTPELTELFRQSCAALAEKQGLSLETMTETGIAALRLSVGNTVGDKPEERAMKYKRAVEEIMKTEDGKIAVRWSGTKRFVIIPDDEIALFLIYLVANGENAIKNINSKLR